MPLLTVEGKASQGLAFGEQEETNLVVPFEAIISMYAISNVLMIGPTFDMLIVDSGGALLNPMPQDGTVITVTMGDSRSDPLKMRFRQVGAPQTGIPTAKGLAVRVQCTLDKPKLFHGICQKSIRGTSTTAIKQIAKDCDLTIKDRVDSSVSDDMKWLPMGRQYGHFLGDIASHGWFGEDSAASVVGVTLTGEVVYRDLAKLAKAPPKASFYYGVSIPKNEDNNYIAHSMVYEDLFSTGLALQGYSASRKRFNIDGVLEAIDGINVTQNNERLNISSKVKELAGISRVILGGIDCGNTHDYYEKAEFQNARYRALFSRQRSLVVAQATRDLDLLDPVTIYYLDTRTREPASVSGVITAKTIAIVNGFYVERFNIQYQGEDSEVIDG